MVVSMKNVWQINMRKSKCLLKNKKDFENKMDIGRKICNIVKEGDIHEVHLNKEHKEALYLYQKHHRKVDENLNKD